MGGVGCSTPGGDDVMRTGRSVAPRPFPHTHKQPRSSKATHNPPRKLSHISSASNTAPSAHLSICVGGVSCPGAGMAGTSMNPLYKESIQQIAHSRRDQMH